MAARLWVHDLDLESAKRSRSRAVAGAVLASPLRGLLYLQTRLVERALLAKEQSASAAVQPAHKRRNHMPILLWLIGVPISIIVLLMLFGVLHI